FPTMPLRSLLLLLLFFLSSRVVGQLKFNFNGQPLDLPSTDVRYTILNKDSLSQENLLAINASDWKKLTSTALKISYTPFTFWLKLPLGELKNIDDFDYIHINSPHINRLKCWIVTKDSIVHEFPLTGDNLSFNTRVLAIPAFAFPVQGYLKNDYYFIVAADKRYTKLDLPIEILSISTLIKKQESNNIIAGIFLGLGILLFIFNLYLFISTYQILYFWYSLYLFSILIYIAVNLGLLFQFLYPSYPQLNDIFRPAILAFSGFPLLFFFNRLLNLKEAFPFLFSFNKKILYTWLILCLSAILTSTNNQYQIQGFWVQVNRTVGPIILLIVLIEAYYCLYKGAKYAGFAAISFTGLTVFLTIFSLQQGEIIASNRFTENANYLGLLFETLVITYLLAWRFKTYKDEAEKLLEDKLTIQENLFSETVKFQEQELNRISSLLHDNIGANLGLLRLAIDNMDLTKASRQQIGEQIMHLGEEVRTLSHALSPLTLQSKGLQKSIEDQVQKIRQLTNIQLKVEWLGEVRNLPEQYTVITYRIVQELLQNMVKHSKATNGILQILIADSTVSIYCEDDGVGIVNFGNADSTGLGLKSIERMIGILNGHFAIQTIENEGFSLSIEFKILKNEKA
ncbi:MAG: 7TM diverse intracellular signaling domain-containing protein, partial [Chitinophagaceae bacterium]